MKRKHPEEYPQNKNEQQRADELIQQLESEATSADSSLDELMGHAIRESVTNDYPERNGSLRTLLIAKIEQDLSLIHI